MIKKQTSCENVMSQVEAEVNSLNAKLECYETCIEQLKKEIPSYLAKKSKLMKQGGNSLVTALRNAASLESNAAMQSSLFLCALKVMFSSLDVLSGLTA